MNPIYVSNFVNKIINLQTKIQIFNELISLPWEERVSARKEYFMGLYNEEYKYDDRLYKAKEFTTNVYNIMMEINSCYDEEFNVCFLNRYDHQHNSLGWHADFADAVAVVSLGAEREIWWKEFKHKGPISNSQKQKLENGSLFIMPKGFQKIYVHKIPKHDRPCGIRISLTFRNI